MTDLTIVKGDDVLLEVTLVDSDGDPINLTDATVFFTAKRSFDDSDDDAVIKKDVNNHTDAENGVTTIHITNTESDVDPMYYYYDIQVVDSADSVQTPEKGRLIVKKEVTRRKS